MSVVEVPIVHADPQPLQRPLVGEVSSERYIRRRLIRPTQTLILPRRHRVQQRRVLDRIGDRTDVTDRRPAGQHVGYTSERPLESDRTAQRRRNSHAPSPVGPQRQRYQPRAHGGGRSAGRSSGVMRAGTVRVGRSAVMGVVSRGTYPYFVHGRLADYEHARVTGAKDRGAIMGVGSAEGTAEEGRPVRRRIARDGELVLDS
mmetsp:Transcript_37929/g.113323  ORF Transcript_37929/g.113323 Transcript_37929/m.113323 type:complete len:202 (+) Transcript_37929:996-1601(+)